MENKREPLMTVAFFKDYILSIKEEIEYYKAKISYSTESTLIDIVYLNIFTYNYQLISLLYSIGDDINDLKPPFQECIIFLEIYKNKSGQEKVFLCNGLEGYMQILNILSWALLLSIQKKHFDIIIDIIDSEEIQDSFVDKLISVRYPNRVISKDLMYPIVYRQLFNATESSPDDSNSVKNFLAGWYTNCIRKTSYFDIHNTFGDDSGFYGYWAWEVAAATYCFDVDDSTYRDMRYYPKDLVDYARSFK